MSRKLTMTPGALAARKASSNKAAEKKRKQTHCKRGHLLSGKNIYTWTDKFNHFHRSCRICKRDQRWYRRKGIPFN